MSTLYERLEMVWAARQGQVQQGMGTPEHQLLETEAGILYFYPSTGPVPEDAWFEVSPAGTDWSVQVFNRPNDELGAAQVVVVTDFLEGLEG